MADTDQTKCSCLEVFGEDPDCPLHGMDGLEARIAEKDARIAKLEATIANSDYAHLISIIADIRMKSGVGAKPMLDELADAIAERITASRAECEGLRTALKPFAAFVNDEYDDVPNVVGVALIFDNDEELGAVPFGCFRDARAALSQKESGDE